MLYNGIVDYFATGEGRTIAVFLTYADNTEEARKYMARHVHEYFMIGAEINEGLPTNPEYCALIPSHVLNGFTKGDAMRSFFTEYHVNYA